MLSSTAPSYFIRRGQLASVMVAGSTGASHNVGQFRTGNFWWRAHLRWWRPDAGVTCFWLPMVAVSLSSGEMQTEFEVPSSGGLLLWPTERHSQLIQPRSAPPGPLCCRRLKRGRRQHNRVLSLSVLQERLQNFQGGCSSLWSLQKFGMNWNTSKQSRSLSNVMCFCTEMGFSIIMIIMIKGKGQFVYIIPTYY